MKCGDSHGPGECTILSKGENTKDRAVTDPKTGQAVLKVRLPVRCVNCCTEGHAASSKECPRRQGLLKRTEEKREGLKNGRLVLQSSVGKEVSYASAAKGTLSALTADGNSILCVSGAGTSLRSAMMNFRRIDSDCRRFFGGSLLGCLARIGGFVTEYNRLNDDGQRSQTLLGMLTTLGLLDRTELTEEVGDLLLGSGQYCL